MDYTRADKGAGISEWHQRKDGDLSPTSPRATERDWFYADAKTFGDNIDLNGYAFFSWERPLRYPDDSSTSVIPVFIVLCETHLSVRFQLYRKTNS